MNFFCLGVCFFCFSFLKAICGNSSKHLLFEKLPEWINRKRISLKYGATRLIQGDILIPSTRDNLEKGAIDLSAKRWPKQADGKYVVPYDITEITNSVIIKHFRWAIRYIERGSNIVFREHKQDGEYFLRITDEGGCFSYMGYNVLPGNSQPLSLTRGCEPIGTIVHELGHALGLIHEHSRPDRDIYLDVAYDDSNDFLKTNVRKVTGVKLKSEYDIFSLMHYDSDFTGQPTIVPKDPGLHRIARNIRSFFSSCDWNTINRFYPGKQKPPKCRPGVVPDYLDPSPIFSMMLGHEEAKWLCRYSNAFYFENGSCVLRNRKQFPDVEEGIEDRNEKETDTESREVWDDASSEDRVDSETKQSTESDDNTSDGDTVGEGKKKKKEIPCGRKIYNCMEKCF